MASRTTENRILNGNGYKQGDSTACEKTPCVVCGTMVSKSRSWWKKVDMECKEFDCYCRPCAIFKVFMCR